MAHANVGHPVYDYSTALRAPSSVRPGTGLTPCGAAFSFTDIFHYATCGIIEEICGEGGMRSSAHSSPSLLVSPDHARAVRRARRKLRREPSNPTRNVRRHTALLTKIIFRSAPLIFGGGGNFSAYCRSTPFPFSRHQNDSKIWEKGFESHTRVKPARTEWYDSGGQLPRFLRSTKDVLTDCLLYERCVLNKVRMYFADNPDESS